MTLDESDQLLSEMEVIRRRGQGAVQQLNHDMTRLTDWREHVRSRPLPFVVAAAAAGYLMIPNRRARSPIPTSLLTDPANVLTGRPSRTEQLIGNLRSTAFAFASGWARTAVNNFVKQQIRSLVEQQDDRAERTQRT